MTRTLFEDLRDHIGKKVLVNAVVDVRRDQGKIIFLDLRDRSGSVQAVVPSDSSAMESAKEIRQMYALAASGVVYKRPQKNVNPEKENGDIELRIDSLEILARAQPMPFDLGGELNLETRLDHLPLTLRSQRSRDILSVQATMLEAYRAGLRARGFTEFVAPALVGGDAEGGAAVFKVEYFNETTAYLATSPQLYKQIMVGPLERAFTIAKIFRAERSATTRHIAELTQMDFEMGFIGDHRDVMAVLADLVRDVVQATAEAHPDVFARFNTSVPLTPVEFPALTLREAQEILLVPEEPDLEPEHERRICEWAKEERASDFVFITRYPTQKRAFYTYEGPAEAPYSRSFDLLFRGLEINSGSQRIHEYDALTARMRQRGLDPERFSFYLQAFKYGLPPHGGCSTGLERFTARMLELPSVKEAAAFPRDMTRIDARLSEAPEFDPDDSTRSNVGTPTPKGRRG